MQNVFLQNYLLFDRTLKTRTEWHIDLVFPLFSATQNSKMKRGREEKEALCMHKSKQISGFPLIFPLRTFATPKTVSVWSSWYSSICHFRPFLPCRKISFTCKGNPVIFGLSNWVMPFLKERAWKKRQQGHFFLCLFWTRQIEQGRKLTTTTRKKEKNQKKNGVIDRKISREITEANKERRKSLKTCRS